MVGTWTPPGAIFTFEFDDESFSLKLIKKTSINNDEPISWMTFDVGDQSPISLPQNLWAELRLSLWTQHARRNIYGASMKTYSSYIVKSPTEIIHHNSHLIGGHRTF
jgi:carboxy-cis,cis-muconate cyclase